MNITNTGVRRSRRRERKKKKEAREKSEEKVDRINEIVSRRDESSSSSSSMTISSVEIRADLPIPVDPRRPDPLKSRLPFNVINKQGQPIQLFAIVMITISGRPCNIGGRSPLSSSCADSRFSFRRCFPPPSSLSLFLAVLFVSLFIWKGAPPRGKSAGDRRVPDRFARN